MSTLTSQPDKVSRDNIDATMSSQIAPGHLGNLTHDEEFKLRELWLVVFTALNIAPDSVKVGGTPPTPEKQGGKFGIGKKVVTPDVQLKEAEMALKEELKDVDLKKAHTKFLDMMRSDNPDQVMLRFLRARKWNLVHAASMVGHTLHWRCEEVDLEDMLAKGEVHWITNEPDEGFINQYKTGKSCIVGHDKLNRPVILVEAKKHDPNAQSTEAMCRYTLFNMETTRMCLNDKLETAAVIFDLDGFGLHNMDYPTVKFLMKCFEAHYPESLGYLVIYRAPWVFNAIWRVIKKWIDPVVSSKIRFMNNVKELSEFIDLSQIPHELGGYNKYEYKYLEPTADEDAPMKDTETRAKIQEERDKLLAELTEITIKWIKAGDDEISKLETTRTALIKKIQTNYWKLDPYVRARTVYDRNAVLGEFRDELKAGGVAQPVLK